MLKYPRKLATRYWVINGLRFENWQDGVGLYSMRSECERIVIRRNKYARGDTYTTMFDGDVIGKMYRSERGACIAGEKAKTKKGAGK